MGVLSTGGMASGITAIFFSATSWWKPHTAHSPELYHHVEITPSGGIFSEWPLDSDGNEENACSFWNATHFYSPRTCDTFGVSRLSVSNANRAVERAIKCAAQFDTQCVLSGEIGFSAPAAFLYDAESGFRMVLAPRIVAPPNPTDGAGASGSQESDSSDQSKLVRLQDPAESASNVLFKFNSSVTVEYMTPGSRAVIVETLTGNDAYCVQALRASVSPACWTELD